MESDDPEGRQARDAGDSTEELDEFRGEVGEKYPEQQAEPQEAGQEEQSRELEEFRDEAAEKYPEGEQA